MVFRWRLSLERGDTEGFVKSLLGPDKLSVILDQLTDTRELLQQRVHFEVVYCES